MRFAVGYPSNALACSAIFSAFMVESLNIWGSTVSDWRITPMHFVFGILLMAQLSLPPGATPPQVMTASFKPVAVLKAGQKADIAVSFNVIKPYAIKIAFIR